MDEPLLQVSGLEVGYPARKRRDPPVRAVDGVDFVLAQGTTLGLVGESGSGKSTIGKAVLGLVQPTAGRITLHGRDITHATARERRALSGHLQVIFQDPYGSLNPSRTIGKTLGEPLRVVHRMDRRRAAARVVEVLDQVGMPPDAADRYPAAFSGGQRQRIAIARALTFRPDVIVCDEPTSALDLSVQAQIINLLLDLQERFGLSYLFISHDMDVVRHLSHRIAVLTRGRIVEQGQAAQVTDAPTHSYTRRLLAAVPDPFVSSLQSMDPREG